MSHIIKPIWAEYAAQKEQKNLEDNFNGGLDRLLMCGIDEVSMSDSRNQSRLLDNIKHLIGSSMGTIRAMRSDQKEARYFCNYLLFSNHAGAVRIEPGDRRFNVSPSQNVALDKVYPQIKKEADLMLGEVAAFASLLAHFDYDLFAARTTLENEAKLGMRLAAGSAHDQFFDAVRSFNLDYFVDNVLLQRGDGDDFKEIQRISTAKTVVQSWVRDAEAGTLSFVPLDDIRAVYISMFPAAHVAPTKFGSMARKQNLQTVRKTLPCGTKPRCVEAAWTLSEHAGFESNTAPPIAPETRPATTLH